MIRINLLGVDGRTAPKTIALDIGRGVTVVCSVILVATVLLLGRWHRSLRDESSRVDQQLAAGRQEAARLQALAGEVRQFEQQRAKLRERTALVEQLRGEQGVPVRLLDHVSRSLPDTAWLTSMERQARQVTIEGRSTTLNALSDFVGNLGGGDLLEKPIEIVNSEIVSGQAGPAMGTAAPADSDLIQFTVRARINTPPPQWP